MSNERLSPAGWRDWLTFGLFSPLFLGLAPILGKLAYKGAADPFTVAAVRTTAAALLLWVVYLLFARRFIFIFRAGLISCLVVGAVNGIGSLMYYNGLHLVSASVAQVLNSTYLLFVVLFTRLGGQPLTHRTLLRVGLTMIAVVLLTNGSVSFNDWLGVVLMIGNAVMFAATVILSQRILYEMPPQTVTLYTLTSMAGVVIIARLLLISTIGWQPLTQQASLAIGALGLTTALSRLTLFAGVKKLGGLQTTLLIALETGVTLVISVLFLGDVLSVIQWAGIGLMAVSLSLTRASDIRQAETRRPVVHLGALPIAAGDRGLTTLAHVFFRRRAQLPVPPVSLPAPLPPAEPDLPPPETAERPHHA